MDAITSEQDWDQLAGRGEAAVLFWASWCVPSRTAVESLRALDARYGRRFALGLVDVDRAPALVSRHHIQGLPTLLVLKGGAVRERRVGLMSRDDVMALLDRHA